MNGPTKHDNPVEPLVVSVKEGCAILRTGVTRLYELIHAGEIQSFSDGRSRKILVSSLKDYVKRQLSAEPEKPPTKWTDAATQARLAKTGKRQVSVTDLKKKPIAANQRAKK